MEAVAADEVDHILVGDRLEATANRRHSQHQSPGVSRRVITLHGAQSHLTRESARAVREG